MCEQGYQVLVVEQTDTHEQAEIRRKEKDLKDKFFIVLFNLSWDRQKVNLATIDPKLCFLD